MQTNYKQLLLNEARKLMGPEKYRKIKEFSAPLTQESAETVWKWYQSFKKNGE